MKTISQRINFKQLQGIIIKGVVFFTTLILFNMLDLNSYLAALLALIAASIIPNMSNLKEIRVTKGKDVVKGSKYQNFFKVGVVLIIMSLLVTDFLRYYFLIFAFINFFLAFWVKRGNTTPKTEAKTD